MSPKDAVAFVVERAFHHPGKYCQMCVVPVVEQRDRWCGGCYHAVYCSVACQKNDFGRHKKSCRNIQLIVLTALRSAANGWIHPDWNTLDQRAIQWCGDSSTISKYLLKYLVNFDDANRVKTRANVHTSALTVDEPSDDEMELVD